MKITLRQRYSLIASGLYILLGLIITLRSIVAHVYPLILLGGVLVALGAVKFRDFRSWRQRLHGS